MLTGDELRLLVWADDPESSTVPYQDVNALYVAIRKLRKSLGSYGKWIVNIPKSGYTISEEVEIDEITLDAADASDERYPFIGREAELARLRELISKTPFVTLTGPPGIGSYSLLTEAEQKLLRRLAVFVRLSQKEAGNCIRETRSDAFSQGRRAANSKLFISNNVGGR